MPAEAARLIANPLGELRAALASIIKGKPEAIELAITTLIARGHLLIEDVPGVGKTTLARALARSLGGSYRRIQFTSDLLPSDILGVNVFNQQTSKFEFKPGPIFANVVLADEINRTTPRTQSSLLEAMNDAQVTVDGQTHDLPQPFVVVATQNPQEHYGTYPLPESQMDRFLLRIRIGYPDASVEKTLVAERGGDDPIEQLRAAVHLGDILSLQQKVDAVRVDDSLLDYAMTVVAETRKSPFLSLGVSPRGAINWYRASQARAVAAGRHYTVPDDFKSLALPVIVHRVMLNSQQDSVGRTRDEAERIISDILERVPVPE